MKKGFGFWFLLVAVATMFNSCSSNDGDMDINLYPDPNNPNIAVTEIRLNKTSLTLLVNDEYTLTAIVAPINASDPTVAWTSDDDTIATVSDEGKVTANAVGTVEITAIAGSKIATCTVTVTDDPTAVDQGIIINGIKWATRNVDTPGSFTQNPESAGMFYQWNRKIGWSATNPMINSDGSTTWDATVSGTTWGATNDPSPVGWRVPTMDEIKTLFNTDKVNRETTTVNGKIGIKFTDIATGNTLFLPRCNFRESDTGVLDTSQNSGFYWSSTWDDDQNQAWNLIFGDATSASWEFTKSANAYNIRSVEE